MKTNKVLTNHLSFILDGSGSMSHLKNKVIEFFDSQVKYLAKRSQENDQETRVSVYLFEGNKVSCLIYDRDVLRLPSIADLYYTCGSTNLIDATLQAINDLKLIPELYTDHAFLSYIITDGCENSSDHTSRELLNTINGLGDNWTVAAFVPDASGAQEAQKYGFPQGNIITWDSASSKGVDEIGKTAIAATETFFANRAVGVRGTKTLFKIDVSGVSSQKVRDNLESLPSNEYEIVNVDKDSSIRDFVENKLGTFKVGKNFYQLTKAETVQPYKSVLVKNKISGNLYSGPNARKLLSLPNYEIRVSPGDFGNYKIFIQSSSVNRKLIKGTELVVLK